MTVIVEIRQAIQRIAGLAEELKRETPQATGTLAHPPGARWIADLDDAAGQVATGVQDVDQLFVMSSALDQVLERARALIQPANPLNRTRNLVSSRHYQAALDLLEKESIKFTADSQIPTILSTDRDQEWKGLMGRREDCERLQPPSSL